MIVVDTNVIVALWLPTSTSDLSERVLARDPEWAAPLLWRSELRSVLAGCLRRGMLDLARASSIAEDAETHLRGREFQIPSHEILRRVSGSRCSAYDCEYVVLAEQLGVPLVTSDREILDQFPRIARLPEAFLAR